MRYYKKVSRQVEAVILSAALICVAPMSALGDPNQRKTCHAGVENCSYIEAVEGEPCDHEHDETCYKRVLKCMHEHSDECYTKDEEASPSSLSERLDCAHVHDDNCYEDVLRCSHKHDDNCGYVKAVKGVKCNHACEICGTGAEEEKTEIPAKPGTPADAQPEIEELEAVTLEARSSSLGDIWDAWSGKTSFEFLDGNHGDGSEEEPYMISNKEQLMGFSELVAMGMTIQGAEGTLYEGDYTGCSFALAGNIDMQGADWIPIGFYRDSSEDTVDNVFRGQFDGKGHSVKNIKINSFGNYNNVGFFGVISDAAIENITIIPDATKEINGNDNVGVVVGSAVDSVIRNVKVQNGYIKSTGISGGIAGDVSGCVIENATCENVKINAQNGREIIYVGGIAGIASSSSIADCEVSTGDNATSRIQGTGYIGGIVGYQNNSNIFNTHVSGTIGGYQSKSIGGITGMYSAGKIKVARFEGTIGNSQLGSMAREGTFIGTREGAGTNFNYIDDVAYLFADKGSKISNNVCGSEIPDDNDYTYDAHIGYWSESDLYYTLVQGGSTKNMQEQYFYEELEEGILHVMDKENVDDFVIDHFAPNSVGRPVRGYLVTVHQIDTVANGQSFYDVATLEAKGSSQYSKPLTKDKRGAIAAGSTIYVNTAPNNTENEKYQLEGSPYYLNAKGNKKNTTYSDSSHCYTFKMPAEDIEVSAIYKKVAVSIKVTPETTSFVVTQTRTGNRKNPVKTTEIKSKEGKLIAKYINGVLEQGTQVQPINITATIDANNDVEDNKVKWSIDDPNLINLARNDDETDGYTAKSASISVNLDAQFFKEIIEKLETDQRNGNYQYKIPNTIFGAGHQSGGIAILTAETRPSTSFEGKSCTANCRVNVTFQILDNTYVAAEAASLDKQSLTYTVTRMLTGDRTSPKETIIVTPPQSLTATFSPDFFSRDDVHWTSSDTTIVTVLQDAVAYKEASVSALKDAKWIRDIIATDDGIRANDKYMKISGNGSKSAEVKVNALDKLGNRADAACDILVNFVTDDQTVIHPEGIELDKPELTYSLKYYKAGDINSKTISKTGFTRQTIGAVVLPEIEEIDGHKPYNREVKWTSSEPETLSVDSAGNINVVDEAAWIKDALLKPPYKANKTVTVIAETKDNAKAAECHITLNFEVDCLVADRDTDAFNIILTKTGPRSRPTLTYTGNNVKIFNATNYPDEKRVIWTSDHPEIITVDESGKVTPVITADWIKTAINNYPYTATATANIIPSTADGKADPISINLNFKVVDNTTSSSGGSSSGSGGGGGGGGSSSGVSPSGGVGPAANGPAAGTAAPAGSITGTWVNTADGLWAFTSNGRTYHDEWAYIHNPYALKNQSSTDWFRFDTTGHMVTGWFTDIEGNTFYLSPLPDGTQGHMVTGWTWVAGVDGIERCYYFNTISDGTRGALLLNTTTPDGKQTNENGEWIVDGIVQIRMPEQ